jgi:hypothetical protein
MHHDFSKLSDALDTGLLADDVVIALERAIDGRSLDQAEKDTLETAAGVLREVAHPSPRDQQASGSAGQLRELVATRDQALGVARTLVDPERYEAFFLELANTLEEALRLTGPAETRTEFERALDFFESLGDATLASSREEVTTLTESAWMSSKPTGLF